MRRQRSAAGAVSRPAIISCCSMHARTGRRHAHARSRTAPPSCISCHMRAQAAAWLLMLIAWAALLHPAAASADYAGYNPWNFNKACRYSASNIPAHLFKEGIDGGLDYLFPLETSRAVNKYEKPWEACFGPKETYSLAAVSAGWKLPCKYQINQQGNYDFQEEHACDVLLKSNCYCYALDRFVGSYCEPGLGGTGQAFELPGEMPHGYGGSNTDHRVVGGTVAMPASKPSSRMGRRVLLPVGLLWLKLYASGHAPQLC